MSGKGRSDSVDAAGAIRKTQCLLIGAAYQARPGNSLPDKLKDLRERVKDDLVRMTNYCNKWESNLSISSYFVTDRDLLPADRPRTARSIVYEQKQEGVYAAVKEVKAAITEFIKKSPDDNILIFFSGEGGQAAEIPYENLLSNTSDPPRKISIGITDVRHFLQIPERVYENVEYAGEYPDTLFTKDVTAGLRPNQQLYLILNASYSGGMFNDWELSDADRLTKSVVLFASSEAEGPQTENFVSVFTRHAKPSETLIAIQGAIFKSMHGSILLTMKPEQVNETYL